MPGGFLRKAGSGPGRFTLPVDVKERERKSQDLSSILYQSELPTTADWKIVIKIQKVQWTKTITSNK